MGEPAENLPTKPVQAELIDMAALPQRDDLVELVRAQSFVADEPAKPQKQFNHTGKILVKRLAKNFEEARAICLMLRAGVSQRLVALRNNISTNSVAGIVEAMRDRGELEAVRRHCDRLLDQFVEVGLERVVDGIQHDEIHPGQLPIAVLAAYDKKAQRDAGLAPGESRVAVLHVTAADVLEAHRQAMQAARESQSIGSGHKPLVIEAPATPDTALDTGTPQAAQAPEAGGGIEEGRTAPGREETRPEIRAPKEPPLPTAPAAFDR